MVPTKTNKKLGSGFVRQLSDITYEIRHEITGKTVLVHGDHRKRLHGDGISDNQYDSYKDQDESSI